MNNIFIAYRLMLACVLLVMMPCCSTNQKDINGFTSEVTRVAKMPVIHIILGSTREGRSSDKIARALKQMADNNKNVVTEIVDLRDYQLPFLYDAVPPAYQKEITDATIKKWADKVLEADGFIFVIPVYNAGYPGVFKNALDVLYKEWNGKPVGLVTYSGGALGGVSVARQLREVIAELKMKPTAAEINIPQVWKAFDAQGNLINKNIETDFNAMLDQLIAAK